MTGGICSNPGCALPWTHGGACSPGEMCGTAGCTLPMAHLGICRVQRIWDRTVADLLTEGTTARARAEAHFSRPCTTPGCALITRHEVCIAPLDGGARVSLHPELEFTPWARILTAPVAAAVLLAVLMAMWAFGWA